jgi:nucleoside-diphosphate-sugar epimerase
MSILVTGAPGWLGNELVARFDDAGEEVRCLTLPGIDTSPLDEYDVDIYYGDITDQDSLDEAYTGGVDTVFHCAGIIHPPKLLGVDMFYDINTRGTRNMLEGARKHGADHFVYISSNAAQGFNDSRDELMTEGMPCRPESPYGRSKYLAEEHVRGYEREYGIDYTIVRPCWYYGPGQPERMDTLMEMIAEGNPLMFGDGANLRSMTYIPKLVEALQLVREQSSTAKGETYWVADEKPYTTNHIYETIARLLGVADDYSPRRIPKPASQVLEVADKVFAKLGVYEQNVHVGGEMSRTIACDVTKAKEELGYEPTTDLEPGMRESIEWAREHGELMV